MEHYCVSEVDRNFYSNNLLSNDDFDTDNVDLLDVLGCDATLTAEDLTPDFPDDFPINLGTETLGAFNEQALQDDLLQEYSDSSDSGISGVMGQYSNTPSPDNHIKQEPMSPTPSLSSENSDATLFQVQEDVITIKTESPPPSPFTFTTGQGHIQTIQPPFTSISQPSENISSIVIGGNGILTPINTPTVNINSILNSKVKIQPKPVSNTKLQQNPAVTKTDPNKPLVLTAEEFKILTSQGLLKFDPPQTQQTTPKVEIPVISSPPPSTITTSPIIQADTEIKSLKRQQRMIKNRESASLSRKRKKEYMSTIEEQLREFTLQNQKLKQENELLRQKLGIIQIENEKLKKGVILPPAAKKICLMAVVLFFTLNIGSFSDVLFPANSYSPNHQTDHFVRKGRQLMSLKEDKKNYTISSFLPDTQYIQLRKFMEENSREFPGTDNTTLFDFYTCATYFNKTESLRLADQLSGWMYRHEQQKKKKQRKQHRPPSKPLNPIQSAVSGGIGREHRRRWRDNKNYQMQIFQGDTVKDFWKSLPRRNDTFYVLSFNTDYFLVPATAHNKTTRPRMSLVMPATTLNETMQPPAGNIGMMQIDCEVLNTKLIHVHKSSLPRNAWPKNSTNPTHEEDSFFP